MTSHAVEALSHLQQVFPGGVFVIEGLPVLIAAQEEKAKLLIIARKVSNLTEDGLPFLLDFWTDTAKCGSISDALTTLHKFLPEPCFRKASASRDLLLFALGPNRGRSVNYELPHEDRQEN